MSAKSLISKPLEWSRKSYDWVLKWSEHRWGPYILAGTAFSESSFFLVPPDALILAMGAAKPKKALNYALISTIFSVLGGLFGYFLGWAFWEVLSGFFFEYIIKPEHFELVQSQFAKNTFLALFVAAFTPIPYKVFTLAAGVMGVPLIPFILGSLVGRGLRYFFLGGLLFFFGAPIRTFIEKHFDRITVIVTILFVAGTYWYFSMH